MANKGKYGILTERAKDDMRIFGFAMLRKRWELIPMAALVGIWAVGIAIFIPLVLKKKTDVQFRRNKPAPLMEIDMNTPQRLDGKFVNKYPKEIDELRKELWGVK